MACRRLRGFQVMMLFFIPQVLKHSRGLYHDSCFSGIRFAAAMPFRDDL